MLLVSVEARVPVVAWVETEELVSCLSGGDEIGAKCVVEGVDGIGIWWC